MHLCTKQHKVMLTAEVLALCSTHVSQCYFWSCDKDILMKAI